MKSSHLYLLCAVLSFSFLVTSCITESNKEEDVKIASAQDSLQPDPSRIQQEKIEESDSPDEPAPSETVVEKPAANASSFLEKAIRSHQQDIHIAGLAESKGTNADIKNLARALRTDHQQLLDELKSFHGRGATGPALGKDAAELEKLKEVSFDEAWKRSMLKQQENLINTYTIQLGKVNDPVLQAHINKAISILRSNRQKMEEFISK